MCVMKTDLVTTNQLLVSSSVSSNTNVDFGKVDTPSSGECALVVFDAYVVFVP